MPAGMRAGGAMPGPVEDAHVDVASVRVSGSVDELARAADAYEAIVEGVLAG